jgi:hypothetical protein
MPIPINFILKRSIKSSEKLGKEASNDDAISLVKAYLHVKPSEICVLFPCILLTQNFNSGL